MIRTLFFYIVLVISTAIHGGASIVAALLGVKRRSLYDWGTQGWSKWNLWAAGTALDVQGIEKVPPGPVVYASNHSSMFDIWALAATLPGSTRFVGKEELERIPLLGPAMRAAGHITIDRAMKKRAFEAYDKAARTIRRGFSAVVFPEGTRSRTGELLPFKNAPFALAIVAQVPLVPVYVHSTFQILPKGGFRLRPRPIRILVGEPIATAGMTPEDRERLRGRARAAILALKARVDAGAASP